MSRERLESSMFPETFVQKELETIKNVIAQVHEYFPMLAGKYVLRVALAIYERMK